MIGRRVRDFAISERIGRGGMGSVYRAEHLLLHEPRALKVIRAELFRAVPEAIERFEREARIAVRLRHPNLVLIHDFFVEDGDHFLVMEYVVGESLGELLRRRGALPVDELCRIGAQCCAGLAHAHELGIVHRDLSPENILLTPTASGTQAKIIDFGVARAALAGEQTGRIADARLTHAGDFVGKPRYASPEQAGALRPGEELDGRSDLYSLGLVLYEMATGALPFQSESALGYLTLQLYQAPSRPSELRPDLPPALERVILRCLEKDRTRRFASAAALGEALEAVAAGEAERAARRRAPRSSTPALLLGAAALALIVAAGAAWWWGSRVPTLSSVSPAPALAPAPEPAPAATPAPVPAPAPVAEPSPPIASPEPASPPVAERAAPPAPAPAAEPPAARPAPRPAPAPTAPAVRAFASEAEMQSAFDTALDYEKGHSPAQAIENWKRFRRRGPSHDLDEKAKRRITELTLGGMPSFP